MTVVPRCAALSKGLEARRLTNRSWTRKRGGAGRGGRGDRLQQHSLSSLASFSSPPLILFPSPSSSISSSYSSYSLFLLPSSLYFMFPFLSFSFPVLSFISFPWVYFTPTVLCGPPPAARCSITLTPGSAFTPGAAPCRTFGKTAAPEFPHKGFGSHVLL